MSNITTVAFVPDGSDRGTISLIWSCLSTWFICLWVIFHINIPAPEDSNLKRIFRQIGFMAFGALAPEYIAAMAYTQRQEAKKLHAQSQNLIEIIGSTTNSPVPQRADTDAENQARQTTAETFSRKQVKNWTMKHSWYCVMGGFTITPPEATKPSVVNGEQLLWLLERGHIEMPSITVDDIKDKSKSDSLLKIMAILQVLWFVVQTIARAAQSLPITTLEITTISYIVCMIPVELLWWSKPYNVSCATPLMIKSWPPGTREKLQELSLIEGFSFYRRRDLVDYPRRINFFHMDERWITSSNDIPNWAVTIGVAVLFGGTHILGWDFHFPTHLE
ncbi:hypothetical protein V500_02896 [Pseudogymnoascus sp. VKM F-4518 (FW-2643)]|nr:hypothetical protein V500_02896 [Pseudogymnoascus sp. VKM F-4518 (FW-2643)]